MDANRSLMQRLRRFVGIKSTDEIENELRREPHIQKAHQALDKTDRMMREFEALERRRTHR